MKASSRRGGHGHQGGLWTRLDRAQVRSLTRLAEHQAHLVALDDPIHDLRGPQGALEHVASGSGEPGQVEGASLHGSHEFCWGARRQDAPRVHQANVVAELGLVQVGRAPHDGHATPGQFAYHAPQLAPGDGIHAHAGLVQKQHLGRPQEAAGQPQLLFHAAGELARQTVRETGQIREGQHLGEAFLTRLPHDIAEIGVEVQVLLDAQVFVEAEFLRHVADLLP